MHLTEISVKYEKIKITSDPFWINNHVWSKNTFIRFVSLIYGRSIRFFIHFIIFPPSKFIKLIHYWMNKIFFRTKFQWEDEKIISKLDTESLGSSISLKNDYSPSLSSNCNGFLSSVIFVPSKSLGRIIH